jgi:hypothetical protein
MTPAAQDKLGKPIRVLSSDKPGRGGGGRGSDYAHAQGRGMDIHGLGDAL